MVTPDSSERLVLGPVEQVEGTDTLLGKLLAPGQGKGFSSGGYGSETRNLLFLDGQARAARWLLPDNRHIIARQIDITSSAVESQSRRPVATVVLVKAIASDAEDTDGSLLLLDPTGRHVKKIAEGVREVNHARLNRDGQIALLYERRRKYVIATFDATSLETRSEDELSVPQLK